MNKMPISFAEIGWLGYLFVHEVIHSIYFLLDSTVGCVENLYPLFISYWIPPLAVWRICMVCFWFQAPVAWSTSTTAPWRSHACMAGAAMTSSITTRAPASRGSRASAVRSTSTTVWLTRASTMVSASIRSTGMQSSVNYCHMHALFWHSMFHI